MGVLIIPTATTAERTGITPAAAELIYDSDNGTVYKGDGVTAGGVALTGVAGSVDSVFGRTGAVIAVAGDYTATQITNTPAGDLAAVTVQAALNELDSEKAAAVHTHVGSCCERRSKSAAGWRP